MLKNIGANWTLTASKIASMFVLLPFTIRVLGTEEYGTWILISSMTGYLGLLALGIPMATVRYVAKFSAEGRDRDLNTVVSSCAGLYLLLGLAALILGGTLLIVFNIVYEVPGRLRHSSQFTFALVVSTIALSFMGELLSGIMAAHEDFIVRNKIQLSGLALRTGLTFVLLTLDKSMIWLAVILLTGFAFEFCLSVTVVKHRYPRIRLTLSNFKWSMVRTVFTFSVFVLVLQMGAQLAFQTDSLVIGAFMPTSQIPLFTTASSIGLYLTQFVISIAAVVMPKATLLHSEDRVSDLREMFLLWSKITFSLSILASIYLIVFGPRFLAWWIDPSFEGPSGLVLRILMLGNLLFLPARGVALPIMMGIGKPGLPTSFFAVAAVANLGLSVALVRPLGLPGIAIGTAIPNVLFAVAVIVLACRAADVSVRAFIRYVGARALVGGALVGTLMFLIHHTLDVHGITELVGVGVVTVLMFGLVCTAFVYHGDPYVDVRSRLGRQLGRLRTWPR